MHHGRRNGRLALRLRQSAEQRAQIVQRAQEANRVGRQVQEDVGGHAPLRLGRRGRIHARVSGGRALAALLAALLLAALLLAGSTPSPLPPTATRRRLGQAWEPQLRQLRCLRAAAAIGCGGRAAAIGCGGRAAACLRQRGHALRRGAGKGRGVQIVDVHAAPQAIGGDVGEERAAAIRVEVVGEDAHTPLRGEHRERAHAREEVPDDAVRREAAGDALVLRLQPGAPVDPVVLKGELGGAVLDGDGIVVVAGEQLERQRAELRPDLVGLVDDRADARTQLVQQHLPDDEAVRPLLRPQVEVDDVADLLMAGGHRNVVRQELPQHLLRAQLVVAQRHLDRVQLFGHGE